MVLSQKNSGKEGVDMRYCFRTLKEDTEINEALQKLKGKARAEFIRNALRTYIQTQNIAAELAEIKKSIQEIKEILQQKTPRTQDFLAQPESKNDSEPLGEELFNNIINQFLNM